MRFIIRDDAPRRYSAERIISSGDDDFGSDAFEILVSRSAPEQTFVPHTCLDRLGPPEARLCSKGTSNVANNARSRSQRPYVSTEKGLVWEMLVSQGRPAPLRPSSPLSSKLPARPRPISPEIPASRANCSQRSKRSLSSSPSVRRLFVISRVFSLSFRSSAIRRERGSRFLSLFSLALASLFPGSFLFLPFSLHLISAFRSARARAPVVISKRACTREKG